MTPAAILAKALEPYDSFALGKLARDLGIPAPQVRRAAIGAHGQSTRAAYHLKLCAYLGVDPVTGIPTPGRRVDLDAVLFAMAVKMSRFFHMHTTAEAAQAMKISTAVLSRIQNGDVRSFESMMAACRYGKLDPNNYVVPPAVSRVTPTGKLLSAQENRSAVPTSGGPVSLHTRVRSSRAHRKVPITLATTVRT